MYVAKAEQELDEPINDLTFRKAPPSSSHLSYLTVQIPILRAERGGNEASLIQRPAAAGSTYSNFTCKVRTEVHVSLHFHSDSSTVAQSFFSASE